MAFARFSWWKWSLYLNIQIGGYCRNCITVSRIQWLNTEVAWALNLPIEIASALGKRLDFRITNLRLGENLVL